MLEALDTAAGAYKQAAAAVQSLAEDRESATACALYALCLVRCISVCVCLCVCVCVCV